MVLCVIIVLVLLLNLNSNNVCNVVVFLRYSIFMSINGLIWFLQSYNNKIKFLAFTCAGNQKIQPVICCLHSKAARKKKREEAQKLPEVSKEIYYDVSGDLKTVFGQSKDETDQQEEKMNWDQKEEGEERKEKEEESAPLLSVPSVEKEDLCGFKFSFFGDDTETGSKETGR